MRIAYVTELFPPDVNGVAHTAVRVAEQLRSRGHELLVIAPEPAGGRAARTTRWPAAGCRGLAPGAGAGMTRLVALGDSITLGVGDPVRCAGRGGPRGWRGWAALPAEGLPEPDLHIVAVNGACAADVEHDQLPRALALRPGIASVVAGMNDTLRANFDPGRFAAAAERTVGALRAGGAEVLTMRLPDPGQVLGLPGALARPLARRARQVNLVMDGVAERFGTLHFDAAGDAHAYDRRMWAVDRLHPSERGHRHIARQFHGLLAVAGQPVGPPPGPEPASPPATRRAQLAWLATKGTAWVLRRSTDLVPGPLALAVTEWRAGPRPDAAAPPDRETAAWPG